MDNFTLIKKELKINGIILDDNLLIINDKKYNINSYISILLNKVKKQKEKFSNIFNRMQKELIEMPVGPHQNNMIDDIKYKLFIFSLLDINKFCKSFGLVSVIQKYIKLDIHNFSKQIIYSIPDYRMALQISFRKVQKLKHNINMLDIVKHGKNFANNKYKIAAGIQGVIGPMSNLDYPLGQRLYAWRDTGEQFQGKSYDTQNQQRYTMGLKNYNNDGSVGQGFYMRDLKGEPFKWQDRYIDSPNPILRQGTWR